MARLRYSKGWDLTPKRKVALQRLHELGVGIDSFADKDHYTLWVPFDLDAPVYVEIGYLIAQLGDEEFPERFHTGISDVPTKVLRSKHQPGERQPVEWPDNAPQGMKFRVLPLAVLDRVNAINKERQKK